MLVWGPVVRIPRIPENEKDRYLGAPLESQTTNLGECTESKKIIETTTVDT